MLICTTVHDHSRTSHFNKHRLYTVICISVTLSNMTEGNDRKGTDSETVEMLAVGLLSIYQPKLEQVKGQLQELTKKQRLMLNELHEENIKFSQARHSFELNDMFVKVKDYKLKLTQIRQKMILLHEQSIKLKERAVRLQQKKQKEALDRVQQRENEEQLIAKPHLS